MRNKKLQYKYSNKCFWFINKVNQNTIACKIREKVLGVNGQLWLKTGKGIETVMNITSYGCKLKMSIQLFKKYKVNIYMLLLVQIIDDT